MTELFPVVILAGGLATRLRPATHTMPKSLILINDEPFIAHQLRLLSQQHVRHVVLCVGFLGEQIKQFVGTGEQFGLHVTYVTDGDVLRGTGGAIKNALPHLTEHFFILYGDSYLPCDYQAVQTAFINSQKPALMTVFHNQGLWDSSNIEFQQGQILAYDKQQRTDNMHYIDYGLGVMTKQILQDQVMDFPYDLASLYQQLLKQHQLAAYEVKQRFYEAGSFTGIQELSHYLKSSSKELS